MSRPFLALVVSVCLAGCVRDTKLGDDIVDASIADAIVPRNDAAAEDAAADEGVGPDDGGPLAVVQTSYIKATNTGEGDGFGRSVALSLDGTTLVVGAPYEDSLAGALDGDAAPDSGAVYVFRRSVVTWEFEAVLKAPVVGAGDRFGAALSLANDGNLLVVGAPGEDGGGRGAGLDDDTAPNSGAAYVFIRRGTMWTDGRYIKASNPGAEDAFGTSVACSPNGNTLAVGAPGEDSASLAAGGAEDDERAPDAGAVYVFASAGAVWSQSAYLKASNADAGDAFGTSLGLADGALLVVGAPGEDGSGTGIDPVADDAARDSGAAYFFLVSEGMWSENGYFKAPNADAGDAFGTSLALSRFGVVLVIGAPGEDSASVGVGGDADDDSKESSGAAYVLFYGDGTYPIISSSAWTFVAYTKPFTALAGARFGSSVALSGTGAVLAVGAPAASDTAALSGAVFFYRRASVARVWVNDTRAAPFISPANAGLGVSTALSNDGLVLVAGADGDATPARGVDAEMAGVPMPNSGAAYVFRR